MKMGATSNLDPATGLAPSRPVAEKQPPSGSLSAALRGRGWFRKAGPGEVEPSAVHGLVGTSSEFVKAPDSPVFARQASRQASGFTLLEILIATAAFAIVLTAINSVFYSALRLRNQSTEAVEDALAVQQALTFLRKDIANLVPPGGTFAGQLQTTPSASSSLSSGSTSTGSSGANSAASSSSMALLGAANQPWQSSPEFHTASGTIDETSPWSELQKVYYYLTPSTNTDTRGGSRDLVRSVTRNLLPSLQDQPVTLPLLTKVDRIFFQYYDGLQWKDSWDSATETGTRLPYAIRVQITRSQEERGRQVPAPIEIVVPVLAYGGTNSTDSASTGTGTGGGQ